jgi:hypothetical protein
MSLLSQTSGSRGKPVMTGVIWSPEIYHGVKAVLDKKRPGEVPIPQPTPVVLPDEAGKQSAAPPAVGARWFGDYLGLGRPQFPVAGTAIDSLLSACPLPQILIERPTF